MISLEKTLLLILKNHWLITSLKINGWFWKKIFPIKILSLLSAVHKLLVIFLYILIGEIALTENGNRTGTVVCLEKTDVMILNKDGFKLIIG